MRHKAGYVRGGNEPGVRAVRIIIVGRSTPGVHGCMVHLL